MNSKRYRTWSKSRGARLPSGSYPAGTLVHVVVGTLEKAPWFLEVALAERIFRLLAENPASWVVCLMPDHLHWLLEVEEPLSQMVGRFKSVSSRVAWELGYPARIWQRSFFDRALRSHESVGALAAYIANNPVRGQLVARPEDWPYLLHRLPP